VRSLVEYSLVVPWWIAFGLRRVGVWNADAVATVAARTPIA